MISVILQILLGVGFIYFGYQKFTSEDMKKGFQYFGYGDRFRVFTGAVEIIAAILLIIGIWIKVLAVIGGGLVVVTMIGAIFTHLKIKDQPKGFLMPIVLLIIGLIVTIYNFPLI